MDIAHRFSTIRAVVHPLQRRKIHQSNAATFEEIQEMYFYVDICSIVYTMLLFDEQVVDLCPLAIYIHLMNY